MYIDRQVKFFGILYFMNKFCIILVCTVFLFAVACKKEKSESVERIEEAPPLVTEKTESPASATKESLTKPAPVEKIQIPEELVPEIFFKEATANFNPSYAIDNSFNPETGEKTIAFPKMANVAYFYTLNNEDPTIESNLYAEPFVINLKNAAVTLKVVAIRDNLYRSSLYVKNFKKALYAETPKLTHTHLVNETFTDCTYTFTLSNGSNRYYYWINDGKRMQLSNQSFTATSKNGKISVSVISAKNGFLNSKPYLFSVDVADVVSKLITLEAGSYLRGDNAGIKSDEMPEHRVTLDSFKLGQYEVTQTEYARIFGKESLDTGYNKEKQNLESPANCVSWYRAISYCNKLSRKMGLTPVYKVEGVDFALISHDEIPTTDNNLWNNATCDWNANGYRLPTEAEWEYAAKGGKEASRTKKVYAGSDSLEGVGWFRGNSFYQSRPVGQLAPNALGLYDMSGNVFEWCWDWYTEYSSSPLRNPRGATSGSAGEASRILRGGAFSSSNENCRIIDRFKSTPYLLEGAGSVGFRVARSNIK